MHSPEQPPPPPAMQSPQPQCRPRTTPTYVPLGEFAAPQVQNGDLVISEADERKDIMPVSGEVLVPQAVVYTAGAGIGDYIDKVGGFSERAVEDEFLIIRRNAEVLKGPDIEVRPGDEIVVLPKIPVKSLEIAKTIIQVIYQLALSTAIALGI